MLTSISEGEEDQEERGRAGNKIFVVGVIRLDFLIQTGPYSDATMTIIRASLRTRGLFTTVAPIKRTPVRTAVYTTAFVLSAGLFAVYYSDARSALHRYVLTPLLRNAFDPETGHKIAVKVLKSGLAPRDFTQDDKVLNCQVRLLYKYIS